MQKWEEDYYNRQEAREEGLEEGREAEFAELVFKKLRKGKSLETIVDELESDVERVRKVIDKLNDEV